jgi:hypothetical protein
MNVVFTGPSFDGNGNSIVRSALTYACTQKRNIRVQSSIGADTDVLVASRGDTGKAQEPSRAPHDVRCTECDGTALGRTRGRSCTVP